MAPPGRDRQNPRKKPLFNVKEILLYGSPLWVGLPLISFYFEGWLGLKSALAGLLILIAYIASEIFVSEKSSRLPGEKAVTLMVAGFGIRLIALLVITYFIYRFSNLNLLILLVTVAVGFTTVLFISIKNWLVN